MGEGQPPTGLGTRNPSGYGPEREREAFPPDTRPSGDRRAGASHRGSRRRMRQSTHEPATPDDRGVDIRIAYFSMEVGLRSDLPTYSGGLGVLAGDTIRAAADLGLPFAAISLVHRKGYFRQTLDEEGRQEEAPDVWDPAEVLEEAPERVQVTLEGRSVTVRAWICRVTGVTGREVPVYLLDTDVEENAPEDRGITDHLYGGDQRYRLLQEAVLGFGGVALLRALGHHTIETFHLNEGHSAFLALGLLEEVLGEGSREDPDRILAGAEEVRSRSVFTTHTPVPAGHDRFPVKLVRTVLGDERSRLLDVLGCLKEGEVNMTRVALRFSRFTNGVAMRHGQVSREMFPGERIHAITNGVHAVTWTGDGFRSLFDERISGWRRDPFLLRHAADLGDDELREAHRRSKALLLDEVERRTGRRLFPDVFTLAFARRAVPYKRADLLVSDPERLREAARRAGGLQLLYAGKAHPRDERGKEMIRRVVEAGDALEPDVSVVYLENYDMELGRLLTSGADLWLNNPRKPMEASGTSGMKAALNGVPCLSALDGWWIEGHVEGVTGWSVDDDWRDPADPEAESAAIVEKLEKVILPLYYEDPEGWARVMRWAVVLNGSYFHTRRMMEQYLAGPYRSE